MSDTDSLLQQILLSVQALTLEVNRQGRELAQLRELIEESEFVVVPQRASAPCTAAVSAAFSPSPVLPAPAGEPLQPRLPRPHSLHSLLLLL